MDENEAGIVGWETLWNEVQVENFSKQFATKIQRAIESVHHVPWWHHGSVNNCSCGGRNGLSLEEMRLCQVGYGSTVWIFVYGGVRKYMLREWKLRRRKAFSEVLRRLPRIVLLEMMKHHESQGELILIFVYHVHGV